MENSPVIFWVVAFKPFTSVTVTGSNGVKSSPTNRTRLFISNDTNSSYNAGFEVWEKSQNEEMRSSTLEFLLSAISSSVREYFSLYA